MKRIYQLPSLPDRPVDGNKGTFGRVLVVGGSEGMIGAAALAGMAALRMGAGLVQIAVPRAILQASLSVCPELIGVGLARQFPGDIAKKADALIVGPGMGQSMTAWGWVKQLMRMDKPAVVDADALNLLASREKWPDGFKLSAVLTPHPGEMGRLAKLLGRSAETPADDQGRVELAGAAARAFELVMVLKGHRTVVTDGEKYFINKTGDSTLSKAGTGDVLSGILGALLGQKMDRFEAACLSVHLHGVAGQSAGEKWGMRSALARDVIDALPAAIRTF